MTKKTASSMPAAEIALRSPEFWPLNRLVIHPDNMNAAEELLKDPEEVAAIKALAENIHAMTLFHALLIVDSGKGEGWVAAGRRRFYALSLLASEGRMQLDEPIEVKVITQEEVANITLAENVHRKAPHPARLVRAYKVLADNGTSPAVIAAQFNCTRNEVKRLLALGGLCDEVLAAWRAKKIDLEGAQALTLGDHDQQRALLADLGQNTSQIQAYAIRQFLNPNRFHTGHGIFKFVAKEYAAAGGRTLTDLFAESKAPKAVGDATLLTKLATDKLDQLVEASGIRSEGWAWVEVNLRQPSSFHSTTRTPVTVTPATDEQRNHLAAAEAAAQAAQAAADQAENLYYESDEDDKAEQEAWEAAKAVLAEAETALEALRASMSAIGEDAKACSGAFAYVDDAGELVIHRARMREPDRRKLEKMRASRAEGGSDADATAAAVGVDDLAMSMVYSLSTYKTVALQAQVSNRPRLGLELAATALAAPVLGDWVYNHVPGITVRPEPNFENLRGLADVADHPGRDVMQQHISAWRSEFDAFKTSTEPCDGQDEPETPKAGVLHAFIAGLKDERVHALIAVCIAACIDLRCHGAGNDQSRGLAQLTQLDMREYFNARTSFYLARRSRAQIVAEAKAAGLQVPETWPSMKKAQLVDAAGEALAAIQYVPRFLAA